MIENNFIVKLSVSTGQNSWKSLLSSAFCEIRNTIKIPRPHPWEFRPEANRRRVNCSFKALTKRYTKRYGGRPSVLLISIYHYIIELGARAADDAYLTQVRSLREIRLIEEETPSTYEERPHSELNMGWPRKRSLLLLDTAASARVSKRPDSQYVSPMPAVSVGGPLRE